MLNALSEDTQLIFTIIGIALLFIIVLWNSKRNNRKLYNRSERNFRKNYVKKAKKTAQHSQQESGIKRQEAGHN